jgi:hypothetical protein
VILRNVIDMSRIIADLRQEGWTITEEDLSLLSPYLTPGVKRFGEYGLDFDRELEPSIQQILSRRRSPPSKDGSSELVREA